MASLQHILASEPDDEAPKQPPPAPADAMPPPASVPQHDKADEHETLKSEPIDPDDPAHTAASTTTRRNASGSVSSVYSGNKIKHLKKEDGIPLWRKDIQFDFLKLVFYDQTRCFTKYSDHSKGHAFAEVYVDAMAKSSKCSKILKEKLLADTEGAISMAMVCLLVNVGRMNTTLNCA
jgi:Ino eighty subunit 1